MSRRRRFTRTRGATAWLATDNTAIQLLASNTVYSRVLCGIPESTVAVEPPSLTKFTVQRIVGNIPYGYKSTSAGDSILVYAGIIVASNTTSGGTTVYDPGVDRNAQWLWLNESLLNSSTANHVFGQREQNPMGTLVDIRVKRRIDNAEELMLFVKYVVIGVSGTVTMNIYPQTRVLIKRVA